MKKYSVKTKFVFEGRIEVKADNKMQAIEFIAKHVGLTLFSQGIHTTLPDEKIEWEFPVHPDKIISTPKLCKE